MSCHFASVDIKTVIRDYYTQSLNNKLVFREWLKKNYAIYTHETLGIDPSYQGRIELSEDDLESLPSQEESWILLSSGESNAKFNDIHILTSNVVDNSKDKFHLISRQRKAFTFEQYAMSEAKVFSEPSGWKLFGRTSKEQKVRDSEYKKLKEESKKRTEEIVGQNKHILRKEKLKVDELTKQIQSQQDTQKGLKKKQAQIKTLLDRANKLKELKTQQAGKSVSVAKVAKKQIKLFVWNNDDAYLVYQSLFSPNYMNLSDLKRLKSVIDLVILDNNYLKTRLDSIKNKKEAITDKGIHKLLNIFHSFPDSIKVDGKKSPRTQYVGDIQWEDISQFTLSECYDAYIALMEICKGDMYKMLTGTEIRNTRESTLEKVKKVLSKPKSTFEWDDSIVLGLKQKLLEPNSKVTVEVSNILIQFVKLLCKNKTINKMKDRIKVYLDRHGHAPLTDTGVVCLVSICRYHPTYYDQSTPATSYSEDTKESNITILPQEEVDALCDYDLMRTLDVYNEIKVMYRNNSYPFDAKLPDILEPSMASRKESQNQQMEMEQEREFAPHSKSGAEEVTIVSDFTLDEISLLESLSEVTKNATRSHNTTELGRQLSLIMLSIKSVDAIEPWAVNVAREVIKDYSQYILSLPKG